MGIMEYIVKYVDTAEMRVPIFTVDIFEYVEKHIPGVRKDIVNAYITRYAKSNPAFVRYQKGIYFKTVTTPFGKAPINYTELVRRTYISDGDEVFGYETGPSYMNKIGLTTQMSAQTYIATERTRATIVQGDKNIQLLAPITDITKSNYRYLQFLDILDNRMKIAIEADNVHEILRAYIDKYRLNFETLLYYANYYKNNRLYGRIAELARGGYRSETTSG